MSSDDEGPNIHYRSLVVQRTADLLNVWTHPRFQRDIVPGSQRLSTTEIRLLWLLGSLGSSTPARLVDAAGIPAPSVSKALAKMDAAGLLEREPSATDGRSHTVRLTPDGRRVAQQVYDVGDAMASEIFADWDEADVLALSALLDRFVTEAEAFARRLRSRSTDGGGQTGD